METDFAAVSEQAARESLARGLFVKPRLGVATWAERVRRLPPKAPEPGPWSNARVPYLRAIMDALGDDHPAEEVVFEKSSQVGGSECGLNWIGWTIDESPCEMLVLLPTDKFGKKWVRGKLHPMIAHAATLRKKIPLGRRADAEGNTLEEKHFPGGSLYIGSGNVPTDMAMLSVKRIYLDEVDRIVAETKGEGDTFEIVDRRKAVYSGRSKVFKVSTPTDEEVSQIDQDYRASSGGRYFVPCPHCKTMQVLEFQNLKWTPGQPKGARFACIGCGTLIEERHKTRMLAAGQWRHERPELCDSVIGFHIWAGYTPIGLGDSWAKIAEKWEQAQRTEKKKQVFANTFLGQAYRGNRIKVESSDVAGRKEPYKLRVVPKGHLLLTRGGDCQHDRVEIQTLAHARNERVAVVDYEVIYGAPTALETWAKVLEYLDRPLVNAFGKEMRPLCTLIDAGNWQNEVLNFTRGLKGRGIFASKGGSQRNRPAIGKPTMMDVTFRGATHKRGAEMYVLGVHSIKKTLMARLAADGDVEIADRSTRFSDELGEHYFDGLTAESWDPIKGRWVKRPGQDQNEELDTFIYALAAAMHQLCRVNKMREPDWLRLEEMLEPKEGVAPITVREQVAAFVPVIPIVNNGDMTQW